MITFSIIGIVAFVAAVVFVAGMLLDKAWIVILAAIVLMVSVITYCDGRPEKIAERKAEAIQEAHDAQPHVIREADGCKVYAWKDGMWHYFTRCPDMVSTDHNWEERHREGKTDKVEHKTETIVTTKGQ